MLDPKSGVRAARRRIWLLAAASLLLSLVLAAATKNYP
jgi:hypothetical protein